MGRIALALVALLALAVASWAQQPLNFSVTGPAGSTPLVTSLSGGNVQLAAPLSGASGQWTYLCGFVATSGGTTAQSVQNLTIAGTIAGTSLSPTNLSFEYVFPSTGQGVLGVALGPGCIVSSDKNTTITVTLPAGGSGTSAALTAWGYRL